MTWRDLFAWGSYNPRSSCHAGPIAAVLLTTLAGAAAAVAAEATISVRYGNHPGFGRVVFDAEDGGAIAVEQSDASVTVHLKLRARLPAGGAPRNIRSVSQSGDDVAIELAPGAKLRRLIVNNHLVVDALDAPVAAMTLAPLSTDPAPRMPASTKVKNVTDLSVKSANSPRSNSAPPVSDKGGTEKPMTARPPEPMAAKSGETEAIPRASVLVAKREDAANNVPPELTAGPVSTDASRAPIAPPPVQDLAGTATRSTLAAEADAVPEAGPGHMVLLPFAATVGAAAFRRGADVIIVFDENKPLDLKPLKDDAVFGRASVQLLPSATILTLPLPFPAELRLERRKTAWAITAIGGDAMAPALKSLQPEQQENRILLKAEQSGLVLSIPDPSTGGVLQVGTQKVAGQGVAVARHTPDFGLLSTWQGVVVEALSDGVSLRPSPTGFIIGVDAAGGQLSALQSDRASAAAQASSQMTRIFDLPNLATEALLRRMQGAVNSSATLPLASRGLARRGVAETMLALGMGAEAQSVLALASTGDARADQTPVALALSAAASLISGRTAEADGIDDHQLDGSDEIAFWRALKTAMRVPDSAAAAGVFANTVPLLLSYPAELQHRLTPIVAETLAQGGNVAEAQRIIDANPTEPALALARAFLQQAQGGDPTRAIDMFQTLSNSSDRLVRIRAARACAELRLTSGKNDVASTAEALAKLLFAWRGDEREIDLRTRIAQLQSQARQWRPALQLLRETEQLWPERSAPLRARMIDTFTASLTSTAQAQIRPFDLVAMVEENIDLMPEGEPGMHLAERVIDALAELDLPGRAGPYLEKITQAAPPGVGRASFGGRLAQLRLQQGDNTGALETLKATASDTLPPALLESRTMTFASSAAHLDDLPSAANALRQLDTPAGDRLLADLAEGARNWPEAITAIRRLVSRDVPSGGPITIAQSEVLLRFASAASVSGDTAALAELRGRDLSALPAGRALEQLRIILARPVTSVSDLPRAAREMAMARTVPPAIPLATAK